MKLVKTQRKNIKGNGDSVKKVFVAIFALGNRKEWRLKWRILKERKKSLRN